MARPIRARLDWSALRHNHNVVRRHVGSARVWSVVKADAYGHGLLPAARALIEATDGYALVELEGAVALRDAGITHPILMLEGFYQADELPLYAELELTPVLHTAWQVDALVEACLPIRLPVYLKLNTGMNRLGFNHDEFAAMLARLVAADCIASVTLMTHFADADEARGIQQQLENFRAMAGGRELPVSLANSAALLRFPEAIGDWVRPGIMLYGASPFPAMQSAAELDLHPVMTLESELIAVRELAPGDAIGYGSSFVAEKAMRVGVVACGYGDGYPRHAPTGTPVQVAGQRTRTLGRVSMDKICVDLSELPSTVGVGATVTLWGGAGDMHLSADDVATAAGTVAYEMFCALAARVPIIDVN
ncbi:alanine racemase [Sulfuritalea hydrogenivorans]|uniref:Alanine racemase n=1 Tax=Sulfuritalea hydrogenivorans sk43H TaxID=1223802 RepID=W0SH03_9PROT|nr:alanine racemase [Sulfuritalea hydrogenivorans]MDK9712733.1 alanine racemase [Sulfuritalea sp.]BAO30040.1 alanine racemase [Sulfuritalea hydrogenivorans sk43H]